MLVTGAHPVGLHRPQWMLITFTIHSSLLYGEAEHNLCLNHFWVPAPSGPLLYLPRAVPSTCLSVSTKASDLLNLPVLALHGGRHNPRSCRLIRCLVDAAPMASFLFLVHIKNPPITSGPWHVQSLLISARLERLTSSRYSNISLAEQSPHTTQVKTSTLSPTWLSLSTAHILILSVARTPPGH